MNDTGKAERIDPERLDQMAAEYVLGTLDGGARRRFHDLMLEHAAVRSAVADWEQRLHKLATSVPVLAPRPKVWAQIEARTRRPRPAAPVRASGWRGLWGIGRAVLAAGCGALLAVGVLNQWPNLLVTVDQVAQAEQTLPQSYVGLLLDGEGRPSLLVSSTRHGTKVAVKSLRPIDAPAGKVLQVWALPKDGAPFPIGVARVAPAPGSTHFEMAQSSEALLSKVTQLAVSLEDAPVAAGAQPSGAFLLQGHCVKLW